MSGHYIRGKDFRGRSNCESREYREQLIFFDDALISSGKIFIELRASKKKSRVRLRNFMNSSEIAPVNELRISR